MSAFDSPITEPNNMKTIVYSLAEIDDETYLLLECVVSNTRQESEESLKESLKRRFSATDESAIEEPSSTRQKIPRSSSPALFMTKASFEYSEATPKKLKDKEDEQERKEEILNSENYLWKPLSTMKVPLKYSGAENISITGEKDPELLEELSKKHFQIQRTVRQATRRSFGLEIDEAEVCREQIFGSRIMSLAFLERYLYVIGIVIDGAATELVRRIEVIGKDGAEPAYVWEEVPSLPRPSPFHASLATSNSILVIGGEESSFDRLLELSLQEDSLDTKWKVDADHGQMQVNRKSHCLVEIPGSYCVLGGDDKAEDPLNKVENTFNPMDPYDIIFGWNMLSTMHYKRTCFIAFYHDNYIYAIGGCDKRDEAIVTMERCKKPFRKWEKLDSFRTDTHFLLAFIVDNQICILGGKPITFDLICDTVPSVHLHWEMSPTIGLPTIFLENSFSTVVQLKQSA